MAADYKTLLGIVREFVEERDFLNQPGMGGSGSADLLARARGAIEPSNPKAVEPTPLNLSLEDDCCSKPFQKAARSGALDKADSWTCPKCGTEWAAKLENGTRAWAPVENMEVFHLP